ncbi:Gx transporter family protein [candidate division KSB1 bacterium]|nr:Gx transporter family protein [candidate division KSB1 bacterium]
MNPSPDTNRQIRLALLTALGLILYIFESYLPRPLPWIKPGLANVVTLLALYWYGILPAGLVTLLRVVLGALILGTLFNPAFFLALGGGFCALAAMALTYYVGRKYFSIIGISVIGAFFHILGQLVLASSILIKQAAVLYLLPIMLLSAIVTGMVVGWLARLIQLRLGLTAALIDAKNSAPE